jgi:hypothetical protein
LDANVEDYVTGSFAIQGRFGKLHYIDFLEDMFQIFLRNVSVDVLERIWCLQDTAPSWLDNILERSIGYGRYIACLYHSPDVITFTKFKFYAMLEGKILHHIISGS